MKYYPRVRSKNTTLNGIRRRNKGLPPLPVKSVVRVGSVTPVEAIYRHLNDVPIVEINSIQGVQNSRSKLRMKECFADARIPQADWWTYYGSPNGGHLFLLRGYPKPDNTGIQFVNLPYPILAKRVFGYKGRGMVKLDNQEELEAWLQEHPSTDGWYFEKFHNYSREYRLHCTEDGCFYTCRKMLKEEAEARWYRNDSNSVWILEENELFDKPVNWSSIEKSCVDGLRAVGLDIGAFDVKVQSSQKRNPKYIIIEVNSAPSFGSITEQKYREELPKLIMKKAQKHA